MVEYWVCCKTMDSDLVTIAEVHARVKKIDNTLSEEKRFFRQDIINSIKQNNTWFTCFKTGEYTYEQGEKMHLFSINGDEFIRTDKNNTKSDFLRDIPDCK
ncbi:MAG: DUF3892 domain-containing protein [Thermoplasmatota archaeon]